EDLERETAPKPTVPVVYCSDITSENLATKMAENGSLALFSDEGGIVGTMAGRYSAGQAHIDIYLQGFSGGTAKICRQGKDPVIVRQAKLAIGLSPQPAVLEELRTNQDFVDRGILSRFLITVPSSRIGYRTFVRKEI